MEDNIDNVFNEMCKSVNEFLAQKDYDSAIKQIKDYKKQLEKNNLQTGKNKKIKHKALSNEILSITNENELIKYFNETLGYYDSVDDKGKKEILTRVTLQELRYLYSLLSNLEIPKNYKKIDIINLIKERISSKEYISKLTK